MPRYLTECEKIKKAINKKFSDLDDKENRAETFKIIPQPYAGKQKLYTPEHFPTISRDKTFSLTGGLRYSFGVEFETSQGQVSNSELKKYCIESVGDRSVGAAEYVTSPLHGNKGIELIKAFCDPLNKATLVDDRCGIHVHVGSIFKPTTLKPSPLAIEAPSFSKQFLMNSINLGALLEEELFSAMPANRVPTLYHCHSIRRWAGINEKNYNEYLGAYIFGQKELWFNEEKKPIKPFDFKNYALGAGRNHNSNVGAWAEGRYKWLNLIHSYLNNGHKTIEFRIFSASTVFEKVYAYILTSLAFTFVADNVPTLIKKGVTLHDVFKAAYPKYPELVTFLDDFYEERKAKFNRKNLYPKEHPYLVLK